MLYKILYQKTCWFPFSNNEVLLTSQNEILSSVFGTRFINKISVVLVILMSNLHAFIYAPDVAVENLDIAELGRLLQLVLGCAVNCEDKQGTILYIYEVIISACNFVVLFTQF